MKIVIAPDGGYPGTFSEQAPGVWLKPAAATGPPGQLFSVTSLRPLHLSRRRRVAELLDSTSTDGPPLPGLAIAAAVAMRRLVGGTAAAGVGEAAIAGVA